MSAAPHVEGDEEMHENDALEALGALASVAVARCATRADFARNRCPSRNRRRLDFSLF
mgnify:CR=1 FL=1